jgi:4-hydroxy-3-polyprenylbenzoate decarboxylase
MLKERGQLILVPRETPLNAIHLENLLKLARLGVEIVPAMPSFYHRPERIEALVDTVVFRVLDHIGVPVSQPRWGSAMPSDLQG